MGKLLRDVLRWVEHMDAQEWIIFASVAIILGVLCMRGFGSRSSF
jgi:hypothetical protein